VSLSTALIDRVRVVRKVAGGPRVEGRSWSADTHGEWMRARLFIDSAPETPDAQGGHRHVVATGHVLVQSYADVQASDTLEVVSVAGNGRWRVTGAPQQIRALKTVRALSVPVEQLREPAGAERLT
jgi:hypothetical protein